VKASRIERVIDRVRCFRSFLDLALLAGLVFCFAEPGMAQVPEAPQPAGAVSSAPKLAAQQAGQQPAAQQPSGQQPVVQQPTVQQPTAQQGVPPAASAPSAAAPGSSAAAPTVSAGQQVPADEEASTTFKVQVNEVNLIFAVTDKKGRFVTGLKQENFGLLDDGKPPIAVVGFRQQTNLPLRVGVMVDTSSSIRSRFQFEQDSAVEFFLQTMHRNDRAFVEGFDIQTNLAQDFTNSVDALNQGIRKLRPGGGTALYDALYKTCHEQMLTLRDDLAVRKVLILLSDGDDNYSRAEMSDAIKMCQRSETIVETISTNLSPTKDKGDETLKVISDATGGQAFYPTKLEDVATGFRNIEQELRSQYSLQYRPANLVDNGAFRTIYLQALDPRYKVRASKGYFAPRPPQ
jgi:VWFA-related protein